VPDPDHDDVARRRKPGRKPSRIAAWRQDGQIAERRLHLLRLVLLGLSAFGVLLCLLLWSAGHGYLGLRVLAGVVVLATCILLVV